MDKDKNYMPPKVNKIEILNLKDIKLPTQKPEVINTNVIIKYKGVDRCVENFMCRRTFQLYLKKYDIRKILENQFEKHGHLFESMFDLLLEIHKFPKQIKPVKIKECLILESFPDKFTCIVCLDSISDTILLPCGHQNL